MQGVIIKCAFGLLGMTAQLPDSVRRVFNMKSEIPASFLSIEVLKGCITFFSLQFQGYITFFLLQSWFESCGATRRKQDEVTALATWPLHRSGACTSRMRLVGVSHVR